MKRMWLAMAIGMATAGLYACDRDVSTVYDPQVDGVLPHPTNAPDTSILDNQKKAYDNVMALAGAGKTVTSAPASAPSGIPAPAGETPATPATPGPEGEGTPAPGATPAPAPAPSGTPAPAPPPTDAPAPAPAPPPPS